MLRIRFFLLAAMLLVTTLAYGQSALDGFAPNVNDAIRIVVAQPDGKILIGGAFTTLSPNGGPTITRNHIARLNPDGTVDAAFDPNANDVVRAIVVQPDGKIVVGGDFNGPNSIGGQTRNRIARLDPVTGAADSFDPNANDIVFALALQPDGKILAGGAFNGANSIGAQPRNRIARLDATTGLADSFDPGASGRVFSIVVQSDGKILTGGEFITIGGQTRNRIARLDATGAADSFDPNANSSVYAIAVQADGKILTGGYFNGANSIGGQTRNHIARLDPITGAADSFDPSADGRVLSIVIQADGKILAGGDFSNIGGQARERAARLHPVTGLADLLEQSLSSIRVYSIAVQADGKVLVAGNNGVVRLETDGRPEQTLQNPAIVGDYVRVTAMQPDGKILIGGSFTTVLGVARHNIARLNSDGTLDTAFNPSSDGLINAIAVLADGGIIAGGDFNNIGGQTRHHIARLDPIAGLADSFNPNADRFILTMVVQADGKILVGGAFNNIGGQTRNHIARLDPNTGLADSFDPNAGDFVYALAVQTDGKILAGGSFFTGIGGQSPRMMARLDPNTGLADSFDPHPNSIVLLFAIQPDGKILVGGGFDNIGGQTRHYIARVDPTTGLADSFTPDPNSAAYAMAVQADGKILVGGDFPDIGGQTRHRIARLNSATGLADSFDPNAIGVVNSLGIQADGKISVGGQFSNIGGQPRNFVARLSNDTSALQNLAVTQTAITWTRGGSSPQFTRVTFESSTDNASFTPLGNGTPAGSNWTLTGLNLPTAQSIYIRGRGFYRSGIYNGSESIAETVRYVFIPPPPPTPTQIVSRKLHNGTPFDIALPLTGSAGVECRSGGGTNDYQLVLTFPSSVTFNNASLTSGAGSISGITGSGTTAITVNLTGVTNGQRITVTLFGVSDGTNAGDLVVPMGLLIGDTNGDGSVNSADISQTKSKSGQAVDGTNFREDLNVDGSINSADISLVKSKSGTGLSANFLTGLTNGKGN